jgi:hypothetical protein
MDLVVGLFAAARRASTDIVDAEALLSVQLRNG